MDRSDLDPFKLNTKWTRDAVIFEECNMAKALSSHFRKHHDPSELEVPTDEKEPRLFGVEGNTIREIKQKLGSFHRLKGGVAGGLGLIGPILLMVLYKDLPFALTATACSTMLFAMGVAWFSYDSSALEVMAAVAGYAAVLVVFIGTSAP